MYTGGMGKVGCIQGEPDMAHLYRDKRHTKDMLLSDGQGKDLKTNLLLTMHKRVAK